MSYSRGGTGRGAGGGGRLSRRFGVAPNAGPPPPIPPERRGRTIRRIVAFFRPYRLQVAVVVAAAILLTSGLGLINPILLKLLIDDAIPSLDFSRLNLYVGLMIGVPIVSGLIGLGQSYLNNLIGQSVMQDLRGALYAHLQRMPLRFFTETKTGEIQSRLANDVGGVQGVVTDTAASLTSNLAVAHQHRRRDGDHRLAADGPLARHAPVLHVPDLPGRAGPARDQRGDPEVAGRAVGGHRGDAVGLGHPPVQDVRPAGRGREALRRPQPPPRRPPDPAGDGRPLVLHDRRDGLLHHPGVRLLARRLARDQRRPERPDDRRHRRVHDPPVAPLLPARPAAQRPGRDPGRARALRPDLRVPRDGPGDRRRAGRRRARSGHGPRPRPVPGRRVPLPGCRRRGGGRAPADADRGRLPTMPRRRRVGPRPRRSRTSRSASRASTSRPHRASSSPSSGRPARARRRPPTSCRGSTTSTRGRSRSTGWTSGG